MVDFAPFSAVLVNCQFYRRNKITCFVLDDKCAPAASISSDDIRLSVVFLSGTWYPTGRIKRIFDLSDVLILLSFVLE